MSLFPVREMFPFNQFDKKAKELILHFYLAHKNWTSADGQIKQLASKDHPEILLNVQDPVYRLTPLALAVMQKETERAARLIEAGAKLDPKDIHGWTPLHYAELQQDEPMEQLLLAAGKAQGLALESIANHAGLSPKEQYARTLIGPSSDDEIVFSCKNEDRLEDRTAAAFRELTGATFVKRSLVSPAGLAKEWMDTAKLQQMKVDQLAKRRFESLEGNPPKLFIGSNEENTGFGLFTDTKLKKGTWLTTYAGEVGADYKDPDYQFEQIEAARYRNLGPMANDSFPNVRFRTFPYLDGLFRVTVLETIRPVSKGEELVVDYRKRHAVKKKHRELKTEHLENYFKVNTLMRLKASLVAPQNEQSDAQKEILEYLTGTPSSVFHLLLKGLISLNDLKQFWFCQMQTLPGDLYSFAYTILDAFDKLRFSEPLKNELVELNQSKSAITMTFILRYLKETALNQRAISWDELQPQVETIEQIAETFNRISTLPDNEEWRPDRELFQQYVEAVEKSSLAMQKYWFDLMKRSTENAGYWEVSKETWSEIRWQNQEQKDAFLS